MRAFANVSAISLAWLIAIAKIKFQNETVNLKSGVINIKKLNLIQPSNLDKYFYECENEYREYSRHIEMLYKNHKTKIHGAGHIKRVLLNALIIMNCISDESFKFSETEKSAVINFCVFHDIGRDNDFVDDEHGRKSTRYMKEQKLEYLNLDKNYFDMVNLFIENHCLHDAIGINEADSLILKQNIDKNRIVFLFKLCKDVDGLDRVRLGDLDSNYLRTDSAKKMPLISYEILKRQN